MTKLTQNDDDPTMTAILTSREEAKASCTSECQSTNHRAPKADPTTAPTVTWFSVWRRWDTRTQDCTWIRPELDCSQNLKLVPTDTRSSTFRILLNMLEAWSFQETLDLTNGVKLSRALFLPDRRPPTELQAQESWSENLSQAHSTLHWKMKLINHTLC